MNPIVRRVITALSTAAAVVLAIVYAPEEVITVALGLLLGCVLLEYLLLLGKKMPIASGRATAWFLGGVPVLALPFVSLAYACHFHGNLMMLYLIAIVKVGDMGGFALGVSTAKLMRGGNHKLCPTISPNKSWEGLFGSVLAACILSCAFLPITHFAWYKALAFGVAAALVGTFGDLVESKFKRWVGVKDSATFMPAGLGGFLDMFDSLLFAPAVLLPFLSMPVDREIVVCDQLEQTIDIYNASGSNVWRWAAANDPGIPEKFKARFANNVAECKCLDGGAKIGMVSCGGRWAIVDRATCRAVAWGMNGGWGHSIESVGKDVVAVVSTGGEGGNSLYLFDISGGAAMNPAAQKKSVLKFDSPHGLHWDGAKLWVVDTPGLHRCGVARGKDGEPVAEVEKSWLFAPLGVIDGHDLRPIPGSSLLALTTYEKVLFFDRSTEEWREDIFIARARVKAFDPAPDGKSFLVTAAKTKWWTDSLERCVLGADGAAAAFSPYAKFPGAKFYKARWVK